MPDKDAVTRETLQILTTRQYMLEQEYETHVKQAMARSDSQDFGDVQDVTSAINKSLKVMHLCIRKIKFPGDGEVGVHCMSISDCLQSL